MEASFVALHIVHVARQPLVFNVQLCVPLQLPDLPRANPMSMVNNPPLPPPPNLLLFLFLLLLLLLLLHKLSSSSSSCSSCSSCSSSSSVSKRAWDWRAQTLSAKGARAAAGGVG